jgi:hypothetical protein
MMARFLRALARFNDHWVADAIGAISVFAIGYGCLFLGAGLGLK